VRDEHVKDSAQDVTQDVAGDVFGAAEDESLNAFIVERAIFQRPHAALGQYVKDEHLKDAAEGVVEDVPQDVAKDLAFGARAARTLLATPPPPPPPSLCSSRTRAEIWAQLGSSVTFARAVGKRFRGSRA